MDIKYIKDITQQIVNSQFTIVQKRRINDYHDRINFACPYCGDSHNKVNAKRGNIWFNRLFYVCFNCGKKTTFTRFARDFNFEIDPEQKLAMIQHINDNISYHDYAADYSEAAYENLIDMEDLFKAVKARCTPFTDLTPIQKGGGVYKYLLGRGITEKYHNNIYQAKFWLTDELYNWVIVLLNRRDDKLLGIQIRNLRRGKNRMFKIYNYENVLEWVNVVNVDNPIELDESEIVVYNKLSYFFNILNVDFTKKITVFEGYLDSLFYPNSLGVVGVNTDFRFLEDNELDIQYFFDNDKAGFDKSVEKMEAGYSVFLWTKMFNDIVKNKKSSEPYKLMYRISKVKDLNKLDEIVENSFNKLRLYDYFSTDELDRIWIPKLKFKYEDKSDDYYSKNFDWRFEK